MSSLQFVIYSLVVWRISSLLVNEDGPYKIFEYIRNHAQVHTDVLNCVWCTSIWIGVLVALLTSSSVSMIPTLALAYSGIAIIVESVVNRAE